jgi:predicted nucleic acid-binding Zn ribbon protein
MRKRHKPLAELMHIKRILPDVLKSCGVSSDNSLRSIWEQWEGAVGRFIAENAHPVAYKNGLLVIHVASSTWLQHLQFMKSDLIAKLNAAQAQGPKVRDIKLKIGSP